MKYSLLDVLLIMALQDRGSFVSVRSDTFAQYACFCKKQKAFRLINVPYTEWLNILYASRIAAWSVSCRLKNEYDMDGLLPFARYGFCALRLAENAQFLTDIFFKQIQPIRWNIATNSCVIGAKEYPDEGMRWALDIFAALYILKWETNTQFTLNFWQDQGNRDEFCLSVRVYDQNEKESIQQAPAIDLAHVYYCSLADRATWAVQYGPLKMVSKSVWATLDGHVIDLRRMDGNAQRLLWLCMIEGSRGKPIPIKTAYIEVCGKGKYRPNLNITNPHFDPEAELSLDKKIKSLCNARDTIMRKINEIKNKYGITESISIQVLVSGVQMIIK